MSCPDLTPNNVPVGIGYDSKSKPKGFVELSSIGVSNLSSVSITAQELTPSSGPLIINGQVSASQFLGLGVTEGVSSFVVMTDVTPGLDLNSNPEKIVAVGSDGLLNLSSIQDLGDDYYQPLTDILLAISDIDPIAADTFPYIDSSKQGQSSPIYGLGRDLLSEATQVGMRNTLGLGALATVGSLGFNDLDDVDPYTVGEASYLVTVNPAGDGLTLIPSSNIVGVTPSSHGDLFDLDPLSAHEQYMDISGIRAFIYNVSCLDEDPTDDAHLTTKGYVDAQLAAGLDGRQPNSTLLTQFAAIGSIADPQGVPYWNTPTSMDYFVITTFSRLFMANNSNAEDARSYLELGSLALSGPLSTSDLVNVANPGDYGAGAGDLLSLSSNGSIVYTPISDISHSQLDNLLVDDHPIYLLANGGRVVAGNLSGTAAPTLGNHFTNKTYVDGVSSTLSSTIATQLNGKQDYSVYLEAIDALKDAADPLDDGDLFYWDETGGQFVRIAASDASEGDYLRLVGGVPAWSSGGGI